MFIIITDEDDDEDSDDAEDDCVDDNGAAGSVCSNRMGFEYWVPLTENPIPCIIRDDHHDHDHDHHDDHWLTMINNIFDNQRRKIRKNAFWNASSIKKHDK